MRNLFCCFTKLDTRQITIHTSFWSRLWCFHRSLAVGQVYQFSHCFLDLWSPKLKSFSVVSIQKLSLSKFFDNFQSLLKKYGTKTRLQEVVINLTSPYQFPRNLTFHWLHRPGSGSWTNWMKWIIGLTSGGVITTQPWTTKTPAL